jgi:hypothetical protein
MDHIAVKYFISYQLKNRKGGEKNEKRNML